MGCGQGIAGERILQQPLGRDEQSTVCCVQPRQEEEEEVVVVGRDKSLSKAVWRVGKFHKNCCAGIKQQEHGLSKMPSRPAAISWT